MNGICGRCLVYPNHLSYLRAEWIRDGKAWSETSKDISSPAQVLRWIEDIGVRSGGDARYSVDEWSGAVLAVSTWNGDEVCSMHLWTLVTAEMRGVRR